MLWYYGKNRSSFFVNIHVYFYCLGGLGAHTHPFWKYLTLPHMKETILVQWEMSLSKNEWLIYWFLIFQSELDRNQCEYCYQIDPCRNSSDVVSLIEVAWCSVLLPWDLGDTLHIPWQQTLTFENGGVRLETRGWGSGHTFHSYKLCLKRYFLICYNECKEIFSSHSSPTIFLQ